MPFEVKFEDESIPKGQAVVVDGLGEFENGKTRLVSDEENETFMARNQVVSTSVVPKTGETRAVVEPGPSVAEAFKKDSRFTVTKKAQEKAHTDGEGNK